MRKRRNVLISNLFWMTFLLAAICSDYVRVKTPHQRPAFIRGKSDVRT